MNSGLFEVKVMEMKLSEGRRLFYMLFIVGCALTPRVQAENTFEIYTGIQSAPHSHVEGVDSDGRAFDFTAGWEGRSLTNAPPYYGLRWTHWDENVGWGVDFVHSKVYADDETRSENGFRILEMTDGLNNLMVQRTQRYQSDWAENSYLYAGVGLGIAVPHVEAQTTSGSSHTFGYQYGGPSAGYNLGWRQEPVDGLGWFVEYRFTASWLDVELKNDGNLKTRIFTNALNIGLIL